MKQGEIWMADLNPVVGSEQQGIRPVVIISGNAMNNNLGISIVCPLNYWAQAVALMFPWQKS